jgi:hypothetical protein
MLNLSNRSNEFYANLSITGRLRDFNPAEAKIQGLPGIDQANLFSTLFISSTILSLQSLPMLPS